MKTIATILALLAAASSAGCGHITQISTAPEGAKVFVNGQQICAQTPCAYDDKYGLPRRYHLQLQKPGFREVDLYLDKELSIGWWLAAAFLTSYFAPITSSFTFSMADAYSFVLESTAWVPPAAAPIPPAAVAPIPPAAAAPIPPAAAPLPPAAAPIPPVPPPKLQP